MIFLSYILDQNTPTYGNRNSFEITKKSDMSKGDVANDSYISTTVHIGTHVDMPFHFYENGQSIEYFDADFWMFENVLVVEVEPKDIVIKDELIEKLEHVEDTGYEILIVKTGMCESRDLEIYWEKNYGFHPDIYDLLNSKFPDIRVFGFDSISVSSFQKRDVGREAHKRFLNPKKPILLLEDMDLRYINEKSGISKVIVSPLRISNCDGIPCTVFGIVND